MLIFHETADVDTEKSVSTDNIANNFAFIAYACLAMINVNQQVRAVFVRTSTVSYNYWSRPPCRRHTWLRAQRARCDTVGCYAFFFFFLRLAYKYRYNIDIPINVNRVRVVNLRWREVVFLSAKLYKRTL